MHYIKRFLIGLSLIGIVPTSAAACGADTDCMVGDRHYRIAMPKGHDGKTPVGAIVFAHGYQGSAAGIMRNKTLRRTVSDLGVALIAVKSAGADWNLPHAPRATTRDGSEEFKYVDAVIADASTKFAVDTDKLMATGFSAGGMLVWNLICERSDTFAAFAPMAGTFWLETPKTCDGPVANVIHIHGDNDRTVPLSGRPVAGTHQGDVMKTLAMYTEFGKFGAAEMQKVDNLTCENRTNAKGDILNFCMFPGKHSFSSKFVKFAWNSFSAANRF